MKIAIAGGLGRMGKTLLEVVAAQPDITLSGASVQTHKLADAKRLYPHLLISDNIAEIINNSDAIIDFTTPEYSLQIAQICAQTNKIHICGTTGFSAADLSEFANYGAKARIIHAPNMSICVTLFMRLVEQVSAILDEEYDIEISEMHHRFKADAPSGTALGLGKAAAKGRGVVLDEVAVRGRDGITGARQSGSIGFTALRGGDVVGDHTVTFAGIGERLELTHKASNREIYARGAIRAALWAQKQPAGYYSMNDVLGI